MKIAVIGAGKMAQALTPLFVEAGHEVTLSNSRGPESLTELVDSLGSGVRAATVADAVEGADVTLIATPWGKTADAVSVVPDWTDRVVIDGTNNRSAPGPQGLIDIDGRISSEIVAEHVPGAKLVKAFNVTPLFKLAPALGASASEDNAVFVAGDDGQAKARVGELISSIGGTAIDTGDLRTGGYLQGMDGPLAGTLDMLTPAEARERLAQAQAQAQA